MEGVLGVWDILILDGRAVAEILAVPLPGFLSVAPAVENTVK